MARCKLCGSGGWLLATTKDGLCQQCSTIVSTEVSSKLRVINESMEIIKKSKNISTRLSRCDVVEQYAKDLKKYENLGIKVTSPLPSEILEWISQARHQIVLESAQEIFEKAKEKAETAANPKGKASQYTSALEKLLEYKKLVPSASEEVDRIISDLKRLAHEATLEVYLDAARKAEFKGQVKKAVDQYLEALYFLRTDKIDDALQTDQIQQIEAKLQQLGHAVLGKTEKEPNGL